MDDNIPVLPSVLSHGQGIYTYVQNGKSEIVITFVLFSCVLRWEVFTRHKKKSAFQKSLYYRIKKISCVFLLLRFFFFVFFSITSILIENINFTVPFHLNISPYPGYTEERGLLSGSWGGQFDSCLFPSKRETIFKPIPRAWFEDLNKMWFSYWIS